MQELFRKKSSDFNMIQDGMKKMKEFEQKKYQMEQELSDVRRKKQRMKHVLCHGVKCYQYQ